MEEESRFEQAVKGAVKALLSAISLRPVLRRVFTLRAAVVVAVVTQGWYFLNTLLGFAHVGNIFDVFEARELGDMVTNVVSVLRAAAMIGVFLLLLKLLNMHDRSESERALLAAHKAGVISDQELLKKQAQLHLAEIDARIGALVKGGVIESTAGDSMRNLALKSYRTRFLAASLLQAKGAGALDDETYKRLVAGIH